MEDKRIFDEYQVDCNECQSYWLDQCDGVKVGSQKACTAFKAIRRTNIPEQIKNLENRLVRAENTIKMLKFFVLFVLPFAIGIIWGVIT